mgnify:CR=1 FL=1
MGKEYRGKGVGKMLVDALVEFGERHKYLSAQARVAAELDANKFWDSQSFRIIDQITGKNAQ